MRQDYPVKRQTWKNNKVKFLITKQYGSNLV